MLSNIDNKFALLNIQIIYIIKLRIFLNSISLHFRPSINLIEKLSQVIYERKKLPNEANKEPVFI